jgi:preprotein translocase subunit SecF
MDIWAWLGDNILPAAIFAIVALFYRKFDKGMDKIDEALTKVGELVSELKVHQVQQEVMNKSISAIAIKMDKVDTHETRIALIERSQEDCKTRHNEVDKRVRDLEYANAAHSHS